MKRKFLSWGVLVAVAVVFGLHGEVSAESLPYEKIVDKAYATQLAACYTEDKAFKTDLNLNATSTNANFMYDLLEGNTDSKTRFLPNGLTGNAKQSCKDVLKESLARKEKTPTFSISDFAAKKAFAESMGYNCSEAGNCKLRTAPEKAALMTIFSYSDAANDVKLTDSQKLILYQGYLEGVYGVKDVECEGIGKLKASDGWKKVKYVDTSGDGKVQTCKVKIGSGVKVNGMVNKGKGYTFLTKESDQMTADELIAAMNKIGGSTQLSAVQMTALTEIATKGKNYNNLTGDNTGNPDASPEDEEGDAAAASEDDACFSMSGALGWIVCPVVRALAEALDSAYGSFLEPLLAVNPQVLEAMQVDNESGGIYVAWGVFRDIANVVFVIMLLVVIFSQVTGYGIDNYGIKRMLPRLIAAAILVNFSFIICQIAVDLSNIFGRSLDDLLVGIANSVPVSSVDFEGPRTAISAILGNWGVIGAATIGGVVAFGMLTNWAFLSSMFVSIVGGLIAAFTAVVILGVRQAAVIILVVLSPVALVLYILPNTQKFFQQWLKIFGNMLMVYPVCGLVIGGGYFASRVIMTVNGDNFVFQLIALLLLLVPYFFIIPLVRTSMNTLAGIGGKIQAIGGGLRRGAEGRMRGSDVYKNFQTRARGAGAQRSLNRQDKFLKKHRNFARIARRVGDVAPIRAIGAARQENLARQIEMAEQQQQKEIAAAAIMDAKINPDDSDSNLRQRFLGARDDRERSMIAQRWERANRKGFVDSMAQMAVNGSLNAGWAKTYFQNSKDSKRMMEKRNPFADLYIAKGGTDGAMFDGNGALNEGYSKNLEIADVADMSTDALKLGVDSGQISPRLAYNVMHSTAPNVQSGIQSNDDKAKVLNAAAAKYNPGAENAQNGGRQSGGGEAAGSATAGVGGRSSAGVGGVVNVQGGNESGMGDESTADEAEEFYGNVFARQYEGGNGSAQRAVPGAAAGGNVDGAVGMKIEHNTGNANKTGSREVKRSREALTLGNGANVEGQTGAISGFMPTQADKDSSANGFGGKFDAVKAYKTVDGRTILEDNRGMRWDATNGKAVSGGEALSVKTNYNSIEGGAGGTNA